MLDASDRTPFGRKKSKFRRRDPRAVMFVLVPEIRQRRRLSFEAAARQWADRVPGLIDRATPRI